jgi:hypothetical protein
MNQTIQTFYQQAAARNFARDFQLRITSFIVNGIQQLREEDLVFLKTASLPGKTISVQNADFMGLKFNIPGTVQFDGTNNWQTTFYCTQDYRLRDLLETSMLDSFNQTSSTGNMEPRDLESYKITLSLLNDQLETIREYNLLGCFVTNVGAINYNVTGAGAIQEIQTSIAYQYWTSSKESGTNRGIPGAITNVGGALGRIGGTISRVGSVFGQINNIFRGFGR